jgi:putative phosphoesterase
MRIGIVSDTHGHLAYTRKAVEALAENRVERVFHCGDIGSCEIVPLFAPWPTHFVFGNCDHDHAELERTIELWEQTSHGLFGSVELAGTKVALTHGHVPQLLRDAISSKKHRLVCYGHTHLREHHYEGETLVLNPGALFRANPHSIALVDLPELTVTSVEIL